MRCRACPVSVALALGLPESDYRNTIVMVTYLIVLFSILVQGLTIGGLVQRVLTQGAEQGVDKS